MKVSLKICSLERFVMNDYICRACGGKEYKIQGDQRRCVPCTKATGKRHSEKNKKYMAVYYKERKELLAEKSKLYYEKNKDAIAVKTKVYMKENAAIISKRRKIYREKNKELLREVYIKKYAKTRDRERVYNLGDIDPIKKAERQRLWDLNNKERKKELSEVRSLVKWGRIRKPDACPRCDVIVEKHKMHAHLDCNNNFVGFICSFCKGELRCRVNRGEIITYGEFIKESEASSE